jgi:hypothetical protein
MLYPQLGPIQPQDFDSRSIQQDSENKPFNKNKWIKQNRLTLAANNPKCRLWIPEPDSFPGLGFQVFGALA